MPINRCLWLVLIAIFAGLPIGNAADLIAPAPERAGEESGIWGAIAFSPADGRHGFFWGADKRKEAEDTALEHCENAKGRACSVVKVFRNHRHWDDDDGTGFAYEHCAALSVGRTVQAKTPFWGAASATTRREAEQHAIDLCGGEEKQCKIREWVCT
ncbi:DUF4189 domain-containing protein [Mesorhizobium sp. RMAD-H1]|uniref:DUF4189 domain-containing protein n=1 Tax=Mesorhizobium sp. RMAD-H1 TaxID=2587065 RepID=UPI001611A44B|nr:DUF4189 domain-containing protein [Mesorhizobium sp. RMAD-H1]MBB2973234.1 hypothetical protein [Mesorhizobium sp. RMAD-H1]